jgi:pyridoxamine 5'-phosphate oxidase-like protein
VVRGKSTGIVGRQWHGDGMWTKTSGGHVSWSSIDSRLQSSRTIWIATAGPGGPHTSPVWFVWDGERIVFATPSSSEKSRDIAFDPRARLHLESGDDVVILSGRATPLTGRERIGHEHRYREKYVEPILGLHADFAVAGDLVLEVPIEKITAWSYGDLRSRTVWVNRSATPRR